MKTFALGTAQIGQTYGLTNQTGAPDREEIAALVSTAVGNGIVTFDTAQAYGDSEILLGEAFRELTLTKRVQVISKLSVTAETTPDDLLRSIEHSLHKLGTPSLHGLLIHNDLSYPDHVLPLEDTLQKACSEGLIRAWGLSTYEPEKARHLLTATSGALLQAPANALDRRFFRAGICELAHKQNKQLYLRSVFLQGLLLQSPTQLPPHAPAIGPALTVLRTFCQEHSLDQASFVYRYIHDSGWGIPVLGAETASQLKANLVLLQANALSPQLRELWDQTWPEDHLDLIDPRHWPST